MASDRAEKLALNESLFRAANERMAAWEERHDDGESELYFCECANLECAEKVEVALTDYERARRDPALFILAPGHEVRDVETVVDAREGWIVVRKDPEVQEQVERTDPRSA